MTKIQVIAPKGTRFTIGGKLITDSKPITVNSEEFRIRKYLGDGSILLFVEEQEEEPKKRKKKGSRMSGEPVEIVTTVDPKETPEAVSGTEDETQSVVDDILSEDTSESSDN